MAKNKSPAFQFYPDAWLSSTDIQLMNPAEEGAYLRLLCHSWMAADCGLPADDASLAVLSRLGERWPTSAPKIRAKFYVSDGRMFNKRLLEEREKQDAWRAKSSEGGKLSADQRAAKAATKGQPNFKGGCEMVDEWLQPNGQPKVNSSSSSSSSSSKQEQPPKPPAPIGADEEAIDVSSTTSAPSVVRPPVPAEEKPARRKGNRTTEEIKRALGPRLPWWEEFWKVYPNHDAMKPAMDAFERTIQVHAQAAALWKGAKAYAGKFAQDPAMKLAHGATWIHQERWLDDGTIAPPGSGYTPPPVTATSEYIAEQDRKYREEWRKKHA